MNGKRPGGWVALAWRYYRDPKFGRVSDAAELLYLRALAYSGEHETDGSVQRTMLFQLRPRARVRVTSLADQLVRAGLWIQNADGYAVPFETWSRWQETAEQKVEQRRKHAEKVAKWRARNQGTAPSRDRSRDGGSGSGAGAGAVRSTKTPAPHGPSGPEIDHQFPEGQEPGVVIDDHGRWFVALPGPDLEEGEP